MKRLFLCSLLFSSMTMAAPIKKFEVNERFHPITAKHGIVGSQETLASLVGRGILMRGGNAIDAAVATGFALAVTLPRAGNIGGGGFMVIWLAKEKKAIAIDYRETAPKAASKDMFLDANGKVDLDKLIDSYQGVAVPGTVSGLASVLKRYGTMSLSQVLKPSIALARDGLTVTRGLAEMIHEHRARLLKDPESKRIFFKKDGSEYKVGEVFKQTDLAHSLSLIAKKGPAAFYHGEIAQKLVAAMKEKGGLIRLSDLKNYKTDFLKPVTGSFHDYKIISMPPPSSGGVTLIEILNILEPFPLEKYGLNSSSYIHLIAEACNLAYNDRNSLLGDPDFVDVPVNQLTSKAYAKTLRKKLNLKKHTPAIDISTIKPSTQEGHNTTHFVVVDKNGNIVTNTYTLNYNFGSAHIAPGTGFLLNNEMADFTAKPGAPNPFGLIEGEKNAIAPGKHPLSSMTPTIVLNPQGQAFLATGSPGGSQIITTVLQIILNVIVHDLNIATAVSAPRVHSQLWPDVLFVEQGISPDTLQMLIAKGHTIKLINSMGSAQTIAIRDKARRGAADPRRIGAAAFGY